MAGLVLVFSLGIDRIFGEPPSRLHPVVWMGRYLSWMGRFNPRKGVGAFVIGLLGLLLGLALFASAAWLIAWSLGFLPLWLELIFLAVLLKKNMAQSAARIIPERTGTRAS